MSASDIAKKASELVGGDREKTHGDKLDNFDRIARLWNAWIDARKTDRGAPLNAHDVGVMMVMVKAARTLTGSYNPDDYVDMVGYAACAGEVRERMNQTDQSWVQDK